MGDFQGHPFRGNQFKSGGAAVAQDSALSRLSKSQRAELEAVLDAADLALPDEAQRAITSFVGHGPMSRGDELSPGVWSPDRLEGAFGSSPSPEQQKVQSQLESAVAPVHEKLRELFGDSVPAFRAQQDPSEGAPERKLLSWSMSKTFVLEHAGTSRQPATVYSEDEIETFERTAEEKGEVVVGNHTLKREKLGSSSYWMIYRNADEYGAAEPITDTDSVREFARQENASAREYNAERTRKIEKVHRAEIPVADVVWATQRAGQWELIVKSRPTLKQSWSAPRAVKTTGTTAKKGDWK